MRLANLQAGPPPQGMGSGQLDCANALQIRPLRNHLHDVEGLVAEVAVVVREAGDGRLDAILARLLDPAPRDLGLGALGCHVLVDLRPPHLRRSWQRPARFPAT